MKIAPQWELHCYKVESRSYHTEEESGRAFSVKGFTSRPPEQKTNVSPLKPNPSASCVSQASSPPNWSDFTAHELPSNLSFSVRAPTERGFSITLDAVEGQTFSTIAVDLNRLLQYR